MVAIREVFWDSKPNSIARNKPLQQGGSDSEQQGGSDSDCIFIVVYSNNIIFQLFIFISKIENLRYNIYKNKIVIKIPTMFIVGADG
jgi:hypothetical protein